MRTNRPGKNWIQNLLYSILDHEPKKGKITNPNKFSLGFQRNKQLMCCPFKKWTMRLSIIYNTWKEGLREIAEASLGRERTSPAARRQERLTHPAFAKDKAGSLERMFWRRSSLRRATPPPLPLSILRIFPNSVKPPFPFYRQIKLAWSTPPPFCHVAIFFSPLFFKSFNSHFVHFLKFLSITATFKYTTSKMSRERVEIKLEEYIRVTILNLKWRYK